MESSRPLHVRAAPEEITDEALVSELRGLLAQADGMEELAARLGLLSDRRRLQLLFCLHAHPGVRSSDLASAIEAHESTTSHALALLRDAGWVRSRRTGREVRYELADGVIHELLHSLGSAHLPGIHHPGEHTEDPPTAHG